MEIDAKRGSDPSHWSGLSEINVAPITRERLELRRGSADANTTRASTADTGAGCPELPRGDSVLKEENMSREVHHWEPVPKSTILRSRERSRREVSSKNRRNDLDVFDHAVTEGFEEARDRRFFITRGGLTCQ